MTHTRGYDVIRYTSIYIPGRAPAQVMMLSILKFVYFWAIMLSS